MDQFLERHVRRNYRPKPLKEAERLLRLHVLAIGAVARSSEIRRADVRNMLERIVAAGAPIAANRVHGIVRKVFNWCLEQEIIAASPCAGLKPPAGKEGSRDRVLSDDELRRVWRAAKKARAALRRYGAVACSDRPASQRSSRDAMGRDRHQGAAVDASARAGEERPPP